MLSLCVGWERTADFGFAVFRQEWKIRERERKDIIRNLILNTVFSISNKKQNRWRKYPLSTGLRRITLWLKKKKSFINERKYFNIVYIQCWTNRKYNLFLTFASENFNIWKFNCKMEWNNSVISGNQSFILLHLEILIAEKKLKSHSKWRTTLHLNLSLFYIRL